MDEGLRTDFAFHGALFTIDEFVLDLFSELGVAVSNVFELGQVVAVDLFLEDFTENSSACGAFTNNRCWG